MSTKHAGNAGEVKAAASVAGIKSWTLDQVFDVGETTSFDDVGVKAFLPTGSGWSGTFEGYKTGAPLAIGAIIAGEFLETQTATQKFTGNIILTGLHGATGHDGIVTYAYDFQGTGALVIPTA
ncbi:hypothetical protein LCGC14_1744670 [marine sediment metagenome]|uniref:Uncharacterized protein n=1 Tax=marine sediment metagenome TaxID=412755 RepID=A0A0F9H5P6_9ZZZZ